MYELLGIETALRRRLRTLTRNCQKKCVVLELQAGVSCAELHPWHAYRYVVRTAGGDPLR